MKKLLAAIPLVLGLGLTPPHADADDNVVLVELFTSQGCSSCPPADANLGTLLETSGVLGLSMHVDYWDYLGWRDTFGSRAHTERQFAYRDYMGGRVVYTPQMVVHGQHDVPGYKIDRLQNAIATAGSAPRETTITIQDDGGMLKAVLSTEMDPGLCTIWMASYDREQTVEIERGENAGRRLTYHNVVDKLMRVGQWTGSPQ
ncbi:MAG: DUF1223 domain-containing protein, partial [Pseudomonadota bacterium]